MALPVLRRYGYVQATASTWQAVHTAVPAGRALVVGTLVVANLSASVELGFNLAITNVVPAVPNGDLLTAYSVIGVGESYEIHGLVIPAGYFVAVYSFGVTSAIVSVHGEEVDN